MVDQFILAVNGTDFPFRSIAGEYRMIDSPMVPVIIQGDNKARAAVAELAHADVPSGAIARRLQAYTVQIPSKSRTRLVQNGHAAFLHPDLRADQFCVLQNMSLYNAESGLWWEDADYLAEESLLI